MLDDLERCGERNESHRRSCPICAQKLMSQIEEGKYISERTIRVKMKLYAKYLMIIAIYAPGTSFYEHLQTR